MLREGTAVLDKQLHDCKDEEGVSGQLDESHDISQLILSTQDRNKRKKVFKKRSMLRNPGTKEGWKKTLETENRMIQLVAEGDD